MIEFFAKTDIGKVRKENQDAWWAYSDEEQGEFAIVVCDGMGGANAGSIASALAAESFLMHIQECLQAAERVAPDKILRDAVAYANARVFDRAFQDDECQGMGTTLVAVLILGTTVTVVNVGDSRAYLLKPGGELECITNDPSYDDKYICIKDDVIYSYQFKEDDTVDYYENDTLIESCKSG